MQWSKDTPLNNGAETIEHPHAKPNKTNRYICRERETYRQTGRLTPCPKINLKQIIDLNIKWKL